MNEVQFYVSVVVAPLVTITAVFLGVLINNSRMASFEGTVNARFGDFNARFQDLKDLIQAQAERQDAHLRRVEEMLLGKFAELDTRLTRLESRLK